MKTLRVPAILLVLLYLAFVSYVAFSSGQLPARVATHFDMAGQPNGWMSRSSHLLFTLIFGFAFPTFVVGVMFLIRFLPSSLINIPRRDYWLAPERRTETLAYLARHSLWLACLGVFFVIAIHTLILRANSGAQPHLHPRPVLGLAGIFLAGIITWAVAMIRRFRRVPND